jgi:long-chain acyl-CoA synthetase
MYLITESEIKEDITKLGSLWNGLDTFILIPGYDRFDHKWIENAISNIPPELKYNHFGLVTSGSTGQPKLVLGSRKRAEALVEEIHKLQDNEPVTETILILPLSYCYAFVNQWLWSRIKRRSLITCEGFARPDKLKEVLSITQNGMLCMVGAQVPLLGNYFGDNISFPGIIRLNFAGGRFPQEKIPQIKEYFPNAQIYNNYGCTEAMPRLTIRRLEESNDANNIGRPVPGVELKLNSIGEILFRSPYRAVAFYGKDDICLPNDTDWIPSGDIGEQDANGYWYVKGRNNEVFKRYGEKISLSILQEMVLCQWQGEAEFYREKDASGEEGHVLVLSPEANERQIRQILLAFRHNYPRTHWPIRVESTNSMPLFPNGKLDIISLNKIKNKKLHWRQNI